MILKIFIKTHFLDSENAVDQLIYLQDQSNNQLFTAEKVIDQNQLILNIDLRPDSNYDFIDENDPYKHMKIDEESVYHSNIFGTNLNYVEKIGGAENDVENTSPYVNFRLIFDDYYAADREFLMANGNKGRRKIYHRKFALKYPGVRYNAGFYDQYFRPARRRSFKMFVLD